MAGDPRLTVEIFPAGIGDAVLLRCASGDRPVNILVDGGVRPTYEDYLAERLQELRSLGQRLDLLVVTHIDTDHIGGVLKLLKANGQAAKPSVIEIGDIWHNGYRHLGLKGRKAEEAERRKVLAQTSASEKGNDPQGDISVREGDTLARLIAEGGYPWNQAWGGSPAIAGGRTTIAPGVEITLLSPGAGNLKALGQLWRKGLLTMGVSHEAVECPEFETVFEMEIPRADKDTEVVDEAVSVNVSLDPPERSKFIEDTSVTNGSSIAFLLECGGVRALLLGDAFPSTILEQWDALHPGNGRSIVDLVKVSHHGSRHNTSPALVDRIAGRNYVFSTDGSKHEHPNIECLLWIADQCEDGSLLLFNYPSASAERMDRSEAKERFGHRVTIGNGRDRMVLAFPAEGDRGGSNG